MSRPKFMTAIALAVALLLVGVAGMAGAAETPILEPTLPEYNSIPIPLAYENLITREMGGRALNLDVYGGLYGTWESNIFQTSDDQKSDFITTGLLGFIAQYEEKDKLIFLAPGQIAYGWYSDHDDQSGFEANIQPYLELILNPMISVNGSVGWLRDYSTGNANDTGRFQRDLFTGGLGMTISPSDLFDVDLGANAAFRRWHDSSKDPLNYNEYSGFVSPVYTLSPNSKVLARLTVGTIDREEEGYAGANYVEIVGGWNWQYFDAAFLAVEAGWANRDYDDNERFSTDNSDYNGLVVRLRGGYALPAGWSINGSYTHTPQQPETVGYNYDTVDQLSLRLQWVPMERFRLAVNPYVKRVDPSQGEYYTEYGAGVGASYSFTELLSVGAAYSYQKRTFEEDGVDSWDDNRFTVGVNLTL